MKVLLLTGVLIIIATICSAQTASEIETRYGKPTNAYSVGELICMTPEYAADGQVCRMRLYPKRISGDTSYVVKELPFDDFKNAVDQLLPVAARGAKKEPFDALWTTGGGSMWATFTYENVRITYSAGFRFKYDPEVLKRGEFTFLDPADGNDPPLRSDDDFLLFHTSEVEIVTVSWLNRKCS